MRELLRGYGAAAFETARNEGNLVQFTSDLNGFLRAYMDSEPLRRTLSDSSVDTEVRRDIVVDLLEGRATPIASQLLSYLIRHENPTEISSSLATLIVLAEQASSVRSPGDVEAEPQAPHGAIRERIRGYAGRVLQELKTTAEIDETEDELFRFARLLADNPSLRQVLQDINNSYGGRIAIVSDLLTGKVQPTTLRLISYVMRAGRLRDLVGIFDRLVEFAAMERGRRVAEVRAAVDLDDAEKARLATALERLVERPVEVRVVHDPNVIGGVLIAVGDLIIDGTVRIRFERLRDLLAPAS